MEKSNFLPSMPKSILRSIYRKLFVYLNGGLNLLSIRKVFCPFCKWNGIAFFIENSCPVCGSMPRHRLISFAIEYFQIDLNGKTLLHTGPIAIEKDWLSLRLGKGKYIGVDISPNPILTLQCSLTELPFCDQSFDLFIAWHVLEHILADREALQEIYRVLRPGGKALISVPIYPRASPKTFEDHSITPDRYREVYGWFNHVRACGLDYADRIASTGFQIQTLNVTELLKSGTQSQPGFGKRTASSHHEQAKPGSMTIAEQCIRYGLSDKHVAWCCAK
jgi:SAM-dependent methyltransferase